MLFTEFIRILLNEHLPVLIIALPLLTAFCLPLIGKISKLTRKVIVFAVVLTNTILCFILSSKVHLEGNIIYTLGDTIKSISKSPGLDFPIRIILNIDGFGILMAVSSSIIALGIILYSFAYIKETSIKNKAEDAKNTRYYTLVLLVISSINGLVFTGDLFNMFVFFEILTIASTGLILHYKNNETPEAAFKYMTISSVASLFILLAIGILYSKYGALNISMLAAYMQYTFIDKVALCLILGGFVMKCGSVPMHMWLPDAYTKAPSSITALFVVISQISLYALMRAIFTLFGITLNYVVVGWIVILLGLFSMIGGILMALPQKDIKRLMAYHAISQTGYMLLGLGVGIAVLGDADKLGTFGIPAMGGAIFHIINHALYKGLLFLIAGAIFYKLGTTDMNKMGGIAKKMPFLTVLFLIGAFAIAGIPPLNGFASKFILYKSVFMFNPLLSIIAMVISVMTLASFVKVLHAAFLRVPSDNATKNKSKEKKESIPVFMIIGMLIFATLIIILGLFPGFIVDTFISPATYALVDQAQYIGVIIP